MNSRKRLVCGVYSDFALHNAGIGNDMRIILKEIEILDIEIIWLDTGLTKLKKLFNLFRVILFGPKKLQGVDFIFSPHVLPRFFDVPHLLRVHDIFPLTNPKWFKYFSRVFFRLALGTHTDSYKLFDSHSSKVSFQEYFGDLSTIDSQVMYCKIRRLAVDQHCNSCRACNSLIQIKSGSFALAVGTIEPRKNYEFLLESWISVFNDQKKKLPLFIVGEKGWKTNRLIKKFEKNTNEVKWLGGVCDSSLHDLYSCSTVFVSASKAEGFNLPVEEAISYGVPTVVSSIDVHREIYNDRAEFFNHNSIDSLNCGVARATKMKRTFDLHDINVDRESSQQAILKIAIEMVLGR